MVVEWQGPLFYLVKTEVRGLWNHHVDLFKEFIESEQPPSTLTTPPVNDHRVAPSEVDDLGNRKTIPTHISSYEPSQEPEIEMDLDPNVSPVANPSTIHDDSISQVSPSAVSARSYQSRDHRPPHYFKPQTWLTDNVCCMII